MYIGERDRKGGDDMLCWNRGVELIIIMFNNHTIYNNDLL